MFSQTHAECSTKGSLRRCFEPLERRRGLVIWGLREIFVMALSQDFFLPTRGPGTWILGKESIQGTCTIACVPRCSGLLVALAVGLRHAFASAFLIGDAMPTCSRICSRLTLWRQELLIFRSLVRWVPTSDNTAGHHGCISLWRNGSSLCDTLKTSGRHQLPPWKPAEGSIHKTPSPKAQAGSTV